MSSVGVVLSGGGVRALAFHLGTLRWLEQHNYWDRISYLSTVSGGSLAIAAIFAVNNGKWPARGEFSTTVVPRIRRLLVEGKSLQGALVPRHRGFDGLGSAENRQVLRPDKQFDASGDARPAAD
jgi:hypothetical protein